MLQIKTQLTDHKKPKPDENNLGFGIYYTDHMLVIDHDEEQGWHDARIVPYAPLSLDPAAMVLHYAMESFEGMKAYRTPDGSIQLFRPDKNAERMINTNHRMCLPSLPVEDFVQAVKALVSVEQDWVPHQPGTSLYIRPFVIATEPHLGVRPSKTHQFIIICSPVGAYYSTGINPVKIFVEDEYTRACPGGTGFTKCGGNYAASLISQVKAHDLGYEQTLWLDGVEHKYVEEVGSMNCFFKIDGTVYTAPGRHPHELHRPAPPLGHPGVGGAPADRGRDEGLQGGQTRRGIRYRHRGGHLTGWRIALRGRRRIHQQRRDRRDHPQAV